VDFVLGEYGDFLEESDLLADSRVLLEVSHAGRTSICSQSPDVLGGTPVFVGSRVRVDTLVDYFEGDSLDCADGRPRAAVTETPR